jgi:hypothetical protein
MSGYATRLGRVLLPIAAIIAAAGIGCADMGHAMRQSSGMTLDSGMDKKSAMMPEMAGGVAAPTPPPMSEARGEMPVDAASAWNAAQPVSGSPGNSGSAPSADARALAGFPDIERWFVPAAYAADNQVSEKYLIRTGNLSVKLDNLDDGQKKANLIAAKYGGTITESNISKDSGGYRSGSITLRVPAEKFQDVWNELMTVGEVINQQTSTQDVGGDYVSSVSHLKALAAEQLTLQKMFDEALAVQRSRGLGEAYKVLLDTEERLKAVSEEIQSTEDHVKQLADQITRSTITLNLTENPKLPSSAPPDKFNWGLGATFNSAVRSLMETSRSLVQGLIYFTVSLQWIWWLLIYFAARWGWKYYKKVMASEKAARPAPTSSTPDK